MRWWQEICRERAASCRYCKLGAEGKGLFDEVETKTLKKLFSEAIIADRNNEE